jgi:DNA-3-methyladenine glycosylase II
LEGKSVKHDVGPWLGENIASLDLAVFWRFHGQTEPTQPLALSWAQASSQSSEPRPVQLCLTRSGQTILAQSATTQWSSSGLKTGLSRLLGDAQPVRSALDALRTRAREEGVRTDWPAPQRLRLWPMTTPFEAGVRAIVSQQISVKAAMAIRTRLRTAMPSVDGLRTFTPSALQRMSVSEYRACGLSASKARAVQALAASEILPCDWQPAPLSEAQAVRLTHDLMALPGIGPWTAQYTLVRGFEYPDADLSGDQGVRLGLQQWQKRAGNPAPDLPSVSEARQWLQALTPYRTQAAAFLWWLASGDTP